MTMQALTARITPTLLAMIGVLGFALPERAGAPDILAEQAAQYSAESPKTILELQQFRQTASAHIRSGTGKEGNARLVNLNPDINAWYLLSVSWNDAHGVASPETAWHLENPKPHEARVVLDDKVPFGLMIVEGSNRYSCDLFGAKSAADALEQGRNSPLIYYPLCQGRLYLRNPAKGARTKLEAATEFLRNQVWGGEKVIDVFHHLLEDRYRETSDLQAGTQGAYGNGANAAGGPIPAVIDPKYADRLVVPVGLGVTLESQAVVKSGMTPGAWYPAAANPGVYVSVVEPNLLAPAILQSYPKLAAKLDTVEASSLCYLIAFDAERFELGYSLGTHYPEVAWSDHLLPQMKDARLPGPDGIGTIAPLVSTGLIAPDNGRRTIASFTAGFKRSHGAFRSGELSLKNHGSHYGVIEDGVVFSKLQPGLATVYVLDDGSIDMKTWQESDNKLLAHIRHARQNGVPLVEFDESARVTAPGRLVAQWGPGNWSGSEEDKLRTIRGGMAIQKNLPQNGGKRFLIYAVFSDATPSAMARVFQAYQCNYGMLLDMNALEHTYLAVYRRSATEMSIDHLLTGMSVLDNAASSGEIVPRFLGYPDNRDFFYVMRKTTKQKP